MAQAPSAPDIEVLEAEDVSRIRSKIVTAYNKEHPEFLHYWERHNVSAAALKAKGAELVYTDTYDKKCEQHDLIQPANDVLARIPMALWTKRCAANRARSYGQSKALYEEKDGVVSMYTRGQKTGPTGERSGKKVEPGRYEPKKE